MATPTGSTAYNLSARGPVLSPPAAGHRRHPGLPPHALRPPPRPRPGQRVRLEVSGPRPAVLVVDGVTVRNLEPGATVECREGDRPARLVTFGSRDFHAILRAKFHLADR